MKVGVIMSNKIRQVGIVGVGYSVPEQILTNQDLEKIVDTSDEWIISRTGIRERRKVAAEEATSDLASRAALQALKDADVSPEEVDLIILGTATPDMSFPSTACIVQDNIKAVNAAAFDLSAGCTGFVYALNVGQQFVATGQYKTALVIGADCISRILDWEDRNTCVLFGDGAGAAVLKAVDEGGFLAFELGAEGSGGYHLRLPAGGSKKPASLETVEQKEHFVHMDGSDVFKFAVRAMSDSTQRTLENAGLTADDIDVLIPHQANLRIIDAAIKRLKINPAKVVVNLDRYGNMSSGSIPVALAEEVQAGRIKKGDKIVMVGFGAGLTFGSCALEWSK